MTNKDVENAMEIKLEFPNGLPKYPRFEEGIRRAPKRESKLTEADKRLAVKNALRYIPEEYHEQMAKEFYEELMTRGRIYGYRFRPEGKLYGKPIDEYKGKCIEGKAIQVMIDNNLDFEVALYPYELVTYGETGQVCQNWMQYLLIKKRVIDATKAKHYPLEDLMCMESKRSILIGNDDVQELLDLKYEDGKIIPLYNELAQAPSSAKDQKDHIWAKSILMSKKKLKNKYPTITDEEIKQYKEKCNSLANIEILDSVKNQTKGDALFGDWLNASYPDPADQKHFLREHFIPEEDTYEISDFLNFINKREKLLKEKIEEAFPSEFSKLVDRYLLKDKLD